MVLSNAQRRELWAEFMRDISKNREELGLLTKADLRAAIDATDQWIEDNQASFNTALPEAARLGLSTIQKVKLFFFVAKQRYISS